MTTNFRRYVSSTKVRLVLKKPIYPRLYETWHFFLSFPFFFCGEETSATANHSSAEARFNLDPMHFCTWDREACLTDVASRDLCNYYWLFVIRYYVHCEGVVDFEQWHRRNFTEALYCIEVVMALCWAKSWRYVYILEGL